MVRTPYIDGNGLKKGAWSPEEDDKLRAYILKYGHWNWRELPKFAGLTRCGKSCRLRWINYLRPNVKHGNFTEQEEDLIIKLHQQLGNRWSTIAGKLPERTDNEIKNHWHTRLKKRVLQHQPRTKKGRKRKFTGKSPSREPQTMETNIILDSNNPKTNLPVQILESCPIYPSSPQLSSSNNEISTLNSETISSSINDYINDYTPGSGSGLGSSSSVNSGFDGSVTSSWDTLGELADGSFWTEPFSLENNQHHENEFNFPNPILSSPYMSYVEDVDFLSLLSESFLLDGNNLI